KLTHPNKQSLPKEFSLVGLQASFRSGPLPSALETRKEKNASIGLWLGFTIVMTLLVFSFTCMLMGNNTGGGILLSGTVIQIIPVFIARQKSEKKSKDSNIE
ncbi:MAG: hypothetical protein AB1847_23490, partial [bacterium]